MRKKNLIPIAIELIGIATIGSGIGFEIALGGHIGYVIITAGSCMVAMGGVIWGKFMRRNR